MNRTYFGFYWKYNVHQGDAPIPSMGRVCYVVDCFGNMTMVNNARLVFSLQ